MYEFLDIKDMHQHSPPVPACDYAGADADSEEMSCLSPLQLIPCHAVQ